MHAAFYSLLNSGTVEPTFGIFDASIGNEVTDPSNASVNIAFNTNGTLTTNADTNPFGGSWISNGTPSNYYLKVTPLSGTFTAGSTGIWNSLSSLRSYIVSRSTVGFKSCTALYEIASDALGVNVVDSATITLTATVNA